MNWMSRDADPQFEMGQRFRSCLIEWSLYGETLFNQRRDHVNACFDTLGWDNAKSYSHHRVVFSRLFFDQLKLNTIHGNMKSAEPIAEKVVPLKNPHPYPNRRYITCEIIGYQNKHHSEPTYQVKGLNPWEVRRMNSFRKFMKEHKPTVFNYTDIIKDFGTRKNYDKMVELRRKLIYAFYDEMNEIQRADLERLQSHLDAFGDKINAHMYKAHLNPKGQVLEYCAQNKLVTPKPDCITDTIPDGRLTFQYMWNDIVSAATFIKRDAEQDFYAKILQNPSLLQPLPKPRLPEPPRSFPSAQMDDMRAETERLKHLLAERESEVRNLQGQIALQQATNRQNEIKVKTLSDELSSLRISTDRIISTLPLSMTL
uniref:Uncharacterized protein n=1 Tax=Picornavirales sp. TaxID=1955153 RepID=A0A514D764_9VIRU|nr:MAG: hypothetical protein H4RhizoLitter20292_000002 [Picornavirales sp.]